MAKTTRKKVKRRKVNFKKVFICLIIVTIFSFTFIELFKIPIKNIYVEGNYYLSDQEVIDLAKISDYPATLKNSKSKLKERLEANVLVKEAVIRKSKLTKVTIEVTENRPLFYKRSNDKYVLIDGTEIGQAFIVPTLINYTPEDKYQVFVDRMSSVSIDVLNRISEIEYSPNNVDKNRFLLYMLDGNVVYVTLNNFDIINNYIDIIQNFDNKKGILYLDSGVYFEIID